jgi:hypothetical protein
LSWRISDRDERCAGAWQRRAGGGLGLGKGGGEIARDAHDLAGGAHLRTEHRVGAVEAVEGEHRLLHRDVVAEADAFVAGGEIERGDALAEHDATGELGEGQADGL